MQFSSIVTVDAAVGRWLILCALLAVRLGAVLLIAPPFASVGIPGRIRVLMVLGWAAALAGASSTAIDLSAVNRAWLVTAFAREALLGAAMACGLTMAVMAFTLGARLIDTQIGFGLGQVLDPVTQQRMPVLCALFTQLALVSFFLIDGHHTLLRAAMLGIDAVPPGAGGSLGTEGAMALTKLMSAQFTLGFMLLAPVVLCLFLTEVALGLLSRNMPQMNMLVLGVPVKIVVALLALPAWAFLSGTAASRVYMTTFRGWEALFR